MNTVVAINGSPRKAWNTATLLGKALEGAAAQGAKTEMVHLYDLDFKGCMSCFACKTKNGKSYGKCGMNDGLTAVLKRITDADALILGSPIYVGSVTGEMRCFLERLLFPNLLYTKPYRSVFPKRMPVGFIYTMNVPEERSREFGYDYIVQSHERYLDLIVGPAESLCSYDTLQFDDYSKIECEAFDPIAKAQRRKEVFPQDCQRAYELGERLVGK